MTRSAKKSEPGGETAFQGFPSSGRATAIPNVFFTDVLPRLARVAERTEGGRAAEGTEGAVARWAVAEHAFMQERAATLPQQVRLQDLRTSSVADWEAATRLREQYLSDLRRYREGLR